VTGLVSALGIELRPLPILVDELDARGRTPIGSKLRLRSSREIGFVSQETAPPVLTASALATFEGERLARRRSRR
jgi:hypothetical protein